ncbi:DNA-processing protein DprA [Nocardiopsis ganjiahuensis]|uniref:DNA-processing protein DprA n=1 Tax=Nocardiopsis ganjiahuensis TaxID=239984 RepID=UPI00034AA067|nr:DNA-processing protein DprA [Nocardiopsis ganjiahuensis]
MEDEVRARVGLTAVAPPSDQWLGKMVARLGAAPVWEALVSGAPPPTGGRTLSEGLLRQWRRWAERSGEVAPDRLLDTSAEAGVRFVAPGDPEWPGRLDELPGGRLCYGLWVRGRGDLRNLCLRSVSVVGSRTATSYGLHVASELSYDLAGRSFTVVSGGAYGIDGAAHRAAHAAGSTVVVLACGLDVDYPRGHAGLFADLVAKGVLVSEWPLGHTPRNPDFLVRNRLIAALTPGTVVVEAGRRSGALNTATHATDLNRVLMAVPGPVTSLMSVGCHRLLREGRATCVTRADEVVELIVPLGEADPEETGPLEVPADLDRGTAQVLAAVTRQGVGPATVAANSTGNMESTMRALGMLAAAGLVERCAAGWRRPARRPKGRSVR